MNDCRGHCKDFQRMPERKTMGELGNMNPLRRPNSSWLSSKLEVKKSETHGKGVFATSRITAGERVAIFGGDVMAIDEIDDLPSRLQKYPMQIEERFVLGRRGAVKPEPADFFNHSCDPNCGFKGQIFLEAMRSIRIGEEVTFDYGMVVSESVNSDVVFEMNCRCNAPNCRKVITENDWKLRVLQRRYEGFFSQYLQEKIEALRKSGR
jgi:SET domain-containing protein